MNDKQSFECLVRKLELDVGYSSHYRNGYFICQSEVIPIAMQADKVIADKDARIKELEDGFKDAVSALNYIRQTHGDLYGVGFDRVQSKHDKAFNETP